MANAEEEAKIAAINNGINNNFFMFNPLPYNGCFIL
jgi:hypothetical protein